MGFIIPNMGTARTSRKTRPPKESRPSGNSGLAGALFATVQQRVLGVLFGNPGRSFYANEVIGLARSGTGAVQRELARLEASGLGTVTSWVVFHQKYYAGFADELPYNVAMVQLDEGPCIFTNLVGIANDDIRIGQRVRVTFRDANEQVSIPVFEPVPEVAP